MSFEPGLLGRPQFFSGETPPDWPPALIPPGVNVVGGGVLGDAAMFRIRTVVFEFAAQSNPRAVIGDIVARAGYAPPAAVTPHAQGGGFAESAPPTIAGKYCSGSVLLTFGPVDSARAPLVFAVSLLDGEAGRQNCDPRNQSMAHQFPVTVPSLKPPAGAVAFGGGSSWSGSSGNMTSAIRTTMAADSVLAHYSAQLVAGGWKSDGRPAIGDGIGAQRFSFREGKEPWTGALIVMAAGDHLEITVRVAQTQ